MHTTVVYLSKNSLFPGGPFVMKEGQDRYILVGTLHGSFVDCSNSWPAIYTRIDEFSILQFIRKIVFNETITNSGKFSILFCCKMIPKITDKEKLYVPDPYYTS